MTRIEALAEMAARCELAQAEVQEAIAILLQELIARAGPNGIPVRPLEDIITVPNLAGERWKPQGKPPGER